MDIAATSIIMNQASIENAVQLSVMKMTMKSAEVNSGEMTNIIDNMAIEEYKGETIDATV